MAGRDSCVIHDRLVDGNRIRSAGPSADDLPVCSGTGGRFKDWRCFQKCRKKVLGQLHSYAGAHGPMDAEVQKTCLWPIGIHWQ